MKRRNIWKERIAKKIYDKKTIWMVRQKIQSRILGKTGKKLEKIKKQTAREKENNRNNQEKRKNQAKKFRSKKVNKRKQQWDGQYGWSILQIIRNSSGWGNLEGRWCHNLAKQLSYYLYFFFFTTQEEIQESVTSQESLGHSHMMSVGK